MKVYDSYYNVRFYALESGAIFRDENYKYYIKLKGSYMTGEPVYNSVNIESGILGYFDDDAMLTPCEGALKVKWCSK